LAATGVVSLAQALMAYEAGAKYVIIYVNRMLSNGLNPYGLIESLGDLKTFKDYDYLLIGASFKSEEEIVKSLKHGLDGVTIPPRLAERFFLNPVTEKSVKAFQKDFSDRYQVPSFKDKS
ncbi:transaldolase family protein, partial [Methanocalculus natronophilus]|uniref:transaldolase family protein n=1 Tax=Methanocalculus natronophilus TaxID=1262400 RepID=UPI0031B5B080